MVAKFIIHKEYSKLRIFNILYLLFIFYMFSCRNDYEDKLKWTLWYQNSTKYLDKDCLFRLDNIQEKSYIYYVFFGSNGEFYHCSFGSTNSLSCYPFENNTDIYYSRLNWYIDRNSLKLPYAEYFIKKMDDSSMVLHQYFVRNRDTTYSNQLLFYKKVDLNSVMFKKKRVFYYQEKDYFQIEGIFQK